MIVRSGARRPHGRTPAVCRPDPDPDRRLHEADTKNNQSPVKVILGGTPGARTVNAPAVGLVNAP